jgi:hypothetical protein
LFLNFNFTVLPFVEYREEIPFVKPAPIDEEETKKQKKQKEGQQKKKESG